jgi:uncharacterized membrane protein YedE/YeeE
MPMILTGLVCGFIFGWGLLISGMMNPAKVLNFLDLFGHWDPTLAVVMGAALIVSGTGFVLIGRRARPYLVPERMWSSQTAIDRELVVGSVLFGIGWGLVGLCPGPAVENLACLAPGVIVFVAAMIAGMALEHLWQRRRIGRIAEDARLAIEADG